MVKNLWSRDKIPTLWVHPILHWPLIILAVGRGKGGG